jgi:hypothetical protein
MSFFNVFLERFISAHGNKYDYSKVVYRGALEKIEIVCSEHGSFWQSPSNHAKGAGCPECAKIKRIETRRKAHPPLSEEERRARRREANRRYAAKPDVRARITERRKLRMESGEAAEYHRHWYLRNRQKVLARVKTWIAQNKDKHKEYMSRYRIGQWSRESVHARIAAATPKWADLDKIREIYDECRRITEETGIPHHVDHIEPLRGADRCGLHVENNLRIVTATENLKKGNSGVTPRKKEFLESLTEDEKKVYVEILFKECRENGFPYYEVPSPDAVIRSVITATKYLEKQSIDSELIATAHGNTIATAFFPHIFRVRMGDRCSPEDVFFDDDKLRAALTKAVHRHDHISDRVIRTAVSLYGGARAVSNFPPMIAAKLYRRFAGDDAVVYDPCGGWGGRMLGAAIAPNIRHYICTEVSKLSVIGLEQLAGNLTSFITSDVIEAPAETFCELSDIDMVFTSPPYFDHEKYSDDQDQSYIKYPTQNEWVDGFLFPLIKNALRMLRSGGVLALNIADVPTFSMLTATTMRLALEVGFKHEVTLPIFIRSTDGQQRKRIEPVFIFYKP